MSAWYSQRNPRDALAKLPKKIVKNKEIKLDETKNWTSICHRRLDRRSFFCFSLLFFFGSFSTPEKSNTVRTTLNNSNSNNNSNNNSKNDNNGDDVDTCFCVNISNCFFFLKSVSKTIPEWKWRLLLNVTEFDLIDGEGGGAMGFFFTGRPLDLISFSRTWLSGIALFQVFFSISLPPVSWNEKRKSEGGGPRGSRTHRGPPEPPSWIPSGVQGARASFFFSFQENEINMKSEHYGRDYHSISIKDSTQLEYHSFPCPYSVKPGKTQ